MSKGREQTQTATATATLQSPVHSQQQQQQETTTMEQELGQLKGELARLDANREPYQRHSQESNQLQLQLEWERQQQQSEIERCQTRVGELLVEKEKIDKQCAVLKQECMDLHGRAETSKLVRHETYRTTKLALDEYQVLQSEGKALLHTIQNAHSQKTSPQQVKLQVRLNQVNQRVLELQDSVANIQQQVLDCVALSEEEKETILRRDKEQQQEQPLNSLLSSFRMLTTSTRNLFVAGGGGSAVSSTSSSFREKLPPAVTATATDSTDVASCVIMKHATRQCTGLSKSIDHSIPTSIAVGANSDSFYDRFNLGSTERPEYCSGPTEISEYAKDCFDAASAVSDTPSFFL